MWVLSLLIALLWGLPGPASAVRRLTDHPAPGEDSAWTQAQEPLIPFERVAHDPTGLDAGHSRGFAWGDLDSDGRADLVVADYAGAQSLYRNTGADGFARLFSEPISSDAGSSEGAFFADFDADGELDVLVTNQFDEPLRLYRNMGADAEHGSVPQFERAVAGDLGDEVLYSANSACWGDYDMDGHLDVFVVNRDGRHDAMFHNRGDGSFDRVRDDPAVTSGGDGRACAWSDIDADGDPDLYVGNFLEGDGKATNFLFINDGGAFRRATEGAPVSDRGRTYGVSFADVDGDGDPDLLVTNIASTDRNLLYLNNGRGSFTAAEDNAIVTAAARPSKGHTFGDFDLDGDLDLYIANGTEGPVDLRNFMFVNGGSGQFTPMSRGPVVEDSDTSASTAWADFDSDGDLDLYVTNWGGDGERNALYRNLTSGRHWVGFSLEGTRSNRMALGARVRLLADIDGHRVWQTRWHWPTTGYASQNEPFVHFGLGDADAVRQVEIVWPSGVIDRLGGLAVNRRYRVVEGTSQATPTVRPDLDFESAVAVARLTEPATASNAALDRVFRLRGVQVLFRQGRR